MSFDTKWDGASDIISDILKAQEAIQAQRFFAMNRKTKEKVFKGSAEYDEMIVENEGVPDDLIVSFNPAPNCSDRPEFINVVDVTQNDCPSLVRQTAREDGIPEIKTYSGNRKERRAAERARRRAEKRRNKY